MWSDILFWSMVGIGVYMVWKTLGEMANPTPPELPEGTFDVCDLKPGHFYLFIYDVRTMSHAMSHKVQAMLTERGIENSFMRVRGIPPVVYDLKRPEAPVEGVKYE